MTKQKQSKKNIQEWVNIRISPETKFRLIELKGKMQQSTYDALLNIMIDNMGAY